MKERGNKQTKKKRSNIEKEKVKVARNERERKEIES